jgi:HrpA-like RNA helicase
MAMRWESRCVDCGKLIAYADSIYREERKRGNTRPVRCTNCEEFLRRELRAVSISQVRLYGTDGKLLSDDVPESPLGKVRHARSVHKCTVQYAKVHPEKYPEMFGVKPEQLWQLYDEISKPEVPVVIAVAPTGSGKSTYLPFRLLEAAADDVPENLFTQFGQIVVTQPRVAPTTSISKFVAEGIHGQNRGIGWDIGYRFSGNLACDWRNRMTYVTDGTLINWLANGDLDKISLVMIDEAHERSNNIDVILSLLARSLPQFPHLKVIIASATIDEKRFKSFFDNALPGNLHCRIVPFSGKEHENSGYERFFRDEIKIPSAGGLIDQQPLDYQPDVTSEFDAAVPGLLADQIMHVLKHMFKVDGYDGVAPNGDPVIASFQVQDNEKVQVVGADIVGFLHGAAAIDECARILKEQVAQYSEMAAIVDVLRLYRDVPDKEQGLAIDDKKDKRRTRVIISSNMAETSLTIDGIVHVVDSGIIKMTRWDPVAEKESLDPITHSKAGCKQRWGRAGRKNPGQAWCLYTRAQFDNDELFQPDSAPEIERSALDPVILSAKAAGGDNLTDGTFPWIGNPKKSEFERGLKRLARLGALDEDGDLTELGLDLRHGGESSESKKLLQLADRFGCGVEMATVLPLMETGINRIFLYDRDWDETTKSSVSRARSRMLDSCEDDLELCLKLFANWKRVQEDPQTIKGTVCNSIYWKEFWKPQVKGEELKSFSNEQLAAMKRRLVHAQSPRVFQELRREFAGSSDSLTNWLKKKAHEFRKCCVQTWAKSYSIDAQALEDAFAASEELIDQLGASKKENERRDIDLRSLGRLRAVFAWSLRDQAFLQDEENSAFHGAQYRPFVAGDNITEAEYQIDRFSAATNAAPLAFVTFGRKDIRKFERGTVVYIPLVISVSPHLLVAVSSMDEFELGLFLAERQLKPASQIQNDELAIRLLMDQVYPQKSRVLCRVVEQQHDRFLVEIIRPIGFDKGVEKLEIGNNRKLAAEERDETGKRKRKSKSADFMVRRGQGNVTSSQEEEPEVNSLLSDHDEVKTNDLAPIKRSAFIEDESNKLIEQIRKRRFTGWLYQQGGPPVVVGQEIQAFVIGFHRTAKTIDTRIIHVINGGPL